MSKYTDKRDPIQYKPTGKIVSLVDCFDKDKTDTLIDEILKSNVSSEEKAFLIQCAYRHTVFNYKNIAEYYCNTASLEMQRLMEKSGVVIIDFNDSIKFGYTKLTSVLQDLQNRQVSDVQK